MRRLYYNFIRKKCGEYAVHTSKKKWPQFSWDQKKLSSPLLSVRHQQGKLIGRMESLGMLRSEASLQIVTLEVLKTSEIEGEILDADQVRSSIARRLGMDISGLVPSDRHVDGVVEMMLDATRKFQTPLTEKRLFSWHTWLFPPGGGLHKLVIGKWRNNKPDDPMQVISGAMGRERVHFVAPDSKLLKKEMLQFMDWFNTDTNTDAVIKAAIAHLWFVTIHPFDDGNGRIARTIADMQLARADGISQRFYSMSAQIRLERKGYYDILEQTQKGTMDITPWLEWFLQCFSSSLAAAEKTLAGVILKSSYWHWLGSKSVNDRQKLMLNKMLDGFDGKVTSSKWAKITKSSQDTAHRDITNLIEQGILQKDDGGGRSTSYSLAEI